MTTSTDICNLALGWLAVKSLTNLITDKSPAADLCRVNYPLLRDAVLEARAWTFASKRITLAATTKPLMDDFFGYSHSFKVPPKCIRVLRVGSSSSFLDRLRWVREEDNILANAGKIYMSYIARIEDSSKFSAAFVQALAARIAADLCIPLTEDRNLQADLWKIYIDKIMDAAATDGTQGRQERLRSDALIIPRFIGRVSIGPYV